MSKKEFNLGDIVDLSAEEWQGISGVVSLPITKESKGHVLIHKDGHIFGVNVSGDEVALADESSKGFMQLAHTLIKLGSHVIEKTLLSS